MLFRTTFAVLLIFFFTITASHAQKSAVTNADRLLASGELSEARTLIDQAIEHEETKERAQTWFVYGRIYQELMNENNINRNWFRQSVRGFAKTKELADGSSNYGNLADMNLQRLYNDALNTGATEYQQGKMEEAYANFELATLAMPQDTTGWLYAGLVAQNLEDPEKVLLNYRKLIGLDYMNIDVYKTIVYFGLSFERDTTATFQVLEMGRSKFPEEEFFYREQINLLIQTGRVAEARTRLEESVRRNPDDANLLYNLGFLYEQSGRVEDAIETYKRSIAVNENYFDALYNLGVLYYNRAADRLSAAYIRREEGSEEQGDRLEAEAGELLNEALPYFKRASDLRSDEPIIWNTLAIIYTRTGSEEQAEAAYKKYEELMEGY